MIVHPNRTHTTTRRLADITSGPSLKKGNRTFRAALVEVTYRWDGSRWSPQWVTTSGPVIKKDGTDSLNTAKVAFPMGTLPAWLSSIVAELCPSGIVVFRETPFETYGA